MDLSTLYWILILPNIGSSIAVVSVFSAVGLMAFSAVQQINHNDSYKEDKKEEYKKSYVSSRKWAASIIVIGLMTNFIPSSKQTMYLIGGYAATNVENIEKLPKNVVDAANKFLESYTDKKKD